jgi:hypothetical protein
MKCMHINICFVCVAKYIIAVAKEIIIVEETTKLSSFNGCYQNWMTYVQFSSTFSTIFFVVLIKVTFMTTLTHYSYSRICD